jgi:hypothetical protein
MKCEKTLSIRQCEAPIKGEYRLVNRRRKRQEEL